MMQSLAKLSLFAVILAASITVLLLANGYPPRASGRTQTPAYPRMACLEGDRQRWIPGGRFEMGTDRAYPEEGPPMAVVVKAFWIDEHDVSNAQFARFVQATHYVTLAERKPSVTEYPDIPPAKLVSGSAVFAPPANPPTNMQDISQWWHFVPGASWRHPEGPGSSIVGMEHFPVVHVAYEDALAYARWAGRDLPSEAEWEFAARGGKSASPDDGNPQSDRTSAGGEYVGNTWQGTFPVKNTGDDGFTGIAPVGCFRPNAYGLYDMIGNVWQWTSTPFQPRHIPHASASIGSQDGSGSRVIKGGSFLCAKNYCARFRPTARQAGEARFSTNHIGFRTICRTTRSDCIRSAAMQDGSLSRIDERVAGESR